MNPCSPATCGPMPLRSSAGVVSFSTRCFSSSCAAVALICRAKSTKTAVRPHPGKRPPSDGFSILEHLAQDDTEFPFVQVKRVNMGFNFACQRAEHVHIGSTRRKPLSTLIPISTWPGFQM